MTHEVTFQWNRQDHLAASRAVTKHMIGGWWIKKGHYFAIAIGIVAIVPLLFAPPDGRLSYFLSALPWLVIIAMWVGLLKVGVPWLNARRVAKEDPSVRGDIHHVVNDSGFAIKTIAASVVLTWAHIRQVVETPDFFLVYHTRNCAHYTPKLAIPPGDLVGIRSVFYQQLGERAKLLEN